MRTSIPSTGTISRGYWFAPAMISLALLLLLGFAPSGFAQSVNGPLNFENNFFVTGDYVVGGAYGMNTNHFNGYTTGIISIPDPNPGIQPGGTANCVINSKTFKNCVPAGAEILAALLYWQTVEKSSIVPGQQGSGQNGFFGLAPTKANPNPPAYPISGVELGTGSAAFDGGGCSSASTTQVVRTYRAPVIGYLPEDPNTGAVLANNSYLITLPSSGSGAPLTLGATLVIIYRILSPTVPLNSIVIYDGDSAQSNSMLNMQQTMQGFYDAASNPVSRLTHIVGSGQINKYQTVYLGTNTETLTALPSLYSKYLPAFPGYYGNWDNPTWTFPNGSLKPVNPGDSSATTKVVPTASNKGCVSWGAVIFSTTVQSTSGDGLLDVWKKSPNPGYCDASVNEGSCGGPGDPAWVSLADPADEPAVGQKDVFVQLDYVCSKVLGAGTCDTTGANYSFDPGPANGAVLGPVVSAFANSVNHAPIHLHIVHGNAISETLTNPMASSLTCTDNLGTNPPTLCPYPGQPGVVGWKGGLIFIQNQLIDPSTGNFCTTTYSRADCVSVLQPAKKDSYHYALFAHAIGLPAWSLGANTLTSVKQQGTTVTFTASTAIGTLTPITIGFDASRNPILEADPSCKNGRVTVAYAVSNPNLNGTFCVQSVNANTFTITVANSENAQYTLSTDPDLEVGTSSANTVSGFSDVGGQDSLITLGNWGTDATPQVKTGTFMHELGHSLGLTHGGFYYDEIGQNPPNYTPTIESNCKSNHQSVMNYMFQIDLLDNGSGTNVPDYSGQSLNSLDKLVAQGSNPFSTTPTYQSTVWHGTLLQLQEHMPAISVGSAKPLTAYCNGAPLPTVNTPQVYRVTQPASSFTWVAGQDINFDGNTSTESSLRGYEDWAPNGTLTTGVDMRQIGATGSLSAAGLVGGGKQFGGGGGKQFGAGGGKQFGGGGGKQFGGGGGKQFGGGGGLGEITQTVANSYTRPPRSLMVTSEGVSPRYINLSWQVPTFGQIGAYRIYRSADGGHTFTLLATVSGSTLTYQDGAAVGPLCNPTGYEYYVTAVLAGTFPAFPPLPGQGQESVPSNTVSTIPPDTTDPLTGCYALAAGMNSVSVIGFASPINGAVYTQGDKIPIAIPVTDDYYPKNGPVPVTADKTLVAIGPLPYDGNCPSISSVPVFLNYNGTYPQPYTILSSGGSGLGLSNNQFTYSWDTTNFNAGCYVFEADFDSGQVNQTEIQLNIYESDTKPHFTTTTLPNATAGISFSNILYAAGGTGSLTWKVTGGALPLNMSLDPGTGTVSGTPTMAGNYNFTVTVTDSLGNFGTRSFTLKVLIFVSDAAPTGASPYVTSTLPTGTAGIPYSNTLYQTGAVGAVTWAYTAGLPPGVAPTPLNSNMLTGTPTTAGNYSFTATATDSAGNTGSLLFNVKVNIFVSDAAPTPTSPYVTSTLPTGTAGIPYSNTLYQTGAVGAVTWSYTGTLPPGTTLNSSTGTLAGTPAAAGTYNFTATATDGSGNIGSLPFTVKVNIFVSDAAPLLTAPWVTPALPTGTAQIPYSNTLYQAGAASAVTWSYTGTLPPGTTLNSATGTISGTPTTAGTYNFTATATDGATNTGSLAFTVKVNIFVSDAPPTGASPWVTAMLPTGTAGIPYSNTLYQAGAGAGLTWSYTGTLPPGTTLNSATGTISGTPTTAGTYNFTATATDGATNTGSLAFTVTVLIFESDAGAPTIAKNLPNATVGTGYSNALDETGAATATVTWSITAGALPPGLSLGLNTGMVSGTPTAPGNYNFTAQVTDMATPPNVASLAFTLSVADAQPGDLIVADGTDSTIFRIAPSGVSGTIAAISNGTPSGVGVDPNSGVIYAAVDAGGLGTPRIVKIDPYGTVTDPYNVSGTTLQNPVAVAVDGSGNVYVADNQLNGIYEYTSGAQQPGAFATFLTSSGNIRIAFDSAGNLDVARDNINGTPGQVEVDQIPSGGGTPTVLYNTTTNASATYMLTAASKNSDGTTTYTGTFSSVPPVGYLVTISGFGDSNDGPFTVASGSSGTQLVLNNSSGNTEPPVSATATATVQLPQIGTVGGIAVLPDGSIDVADAVAKAIYNITNPGANAFVTTAISAAAPGANPPASPLCCSMSGMANSSSGGNTNLYIALNAASQLQLAVTQTPSIAVVSSNQTYSLTAAGAVDNQGSTTYTGTFTPCVPAGASVTIAGFTTAGNNGTFTVVSCTNSTLTVNNGNGVNETNPGTAVTATPLASPSDVAAYAKQH